MLEEIDLEKIEFVAFDWDIGNKDKNWLKHKVTNDESEEIFYNQSLQIFKDPKHSRKEERFVAYGLTDRSRKLTVIFTIRADKIRVISARDQNRKERREYEKVEINPTI